MTANEDQKGKITLGLIISWGLGVFFLLGSLAIFQPASQGMGVASLLIACLLLPPIRGFIHQKTGRSLSTGLRIVLCFILIVAGAAASTQKSGTTGSPAVFASATSGPSAAAPQAAPADKKGIVVEEHALEAGPMGGKITGTVHNYTNKQPAYIQVEFNLLDAEGNQVGSTLANINNLEPGGTWKFEAIVLEQRTTQVKLKGITSF